MPKSINPILAEVTTYRSFSTVAFFDTPKDATPQDCLEVTEKLINQAYYTLSSAIQEVDGGVRIRLEAVLDTLLRASQSLDMLDIAKAVTMAQVED